MEYSGLVTEPVEVLVVQGGAGPSTLYGNLYTADPISGSIVLVVFEGDVNCSSLTPDRLMWIPGDAVRSVKPASNSAPGCRKVTEELRHLFNELLEQKESKNEDTAVVLERRGKLMEWLQKNRVEARRDGESILIFGCVRVEPPYIPSSAYCDNPIVLKRIRTILEKFNNQ